MYFTPLHVHRWVTADCVPILFTREFRRMDQPLSGREEGGTNWSYGPRALPQMAWPFSSLFIDQKRVHRARPGFSRGECGPFQEGQPILWSKIYADKLHRQENFIQDYCNRRKRPNHSLQAILLETKGRVWFFLRARVGVKGIFGHLCFLTGLIHTRNWNFSIFCGKLVFCRNDVFTGFRLLPSNPWQGLGRGSCPPLMIIFQKDGSQVLEETVWGCETGRRLLEKG